MDNIVLDKYRKAGRIAANIRDYGASIIKPGVLFLDVADKLESMIKSEGGNIAFPVNISINEIAAHFSPRHDDKTVFREGDLVKLDVGTQIDGYIADTAITFEINTDKYSDMILSSSDALENAIDFIKAGVNISDIGRIIEDTIKSYGYTPISNLSGHSLNQYDLHSGLSIPNVGNTYYKDRLKAGDVLAIEPFSTDGAGHVVAGGGSNIYLCEKSFRSKIIRDNRSRIIFNKMLNIFKSLPFAERWVYNFDSKNIDQILKKLSFLGLIKHYPQLIEKKGGMVTQKEHTIIVNDNGCEVIT